MCYPKWKVKLAERDLDIIELLKYYDVQFSSYEKGDEHLAKCPFHDDEGFKLAVNKQKKVYYCFECGAKGNMFTFLQEMENLNFPQIVDLAINIKEELRERRESLPLVA